MRPPCNRRPSKEVRTALNRAKNANTPGVTGQDKAATEIATLIATGKITREASHEGKARFRTYEYAENEVRPALEKKYGTAFRVYACVFCNGWHVATEKELTA